MQIDRLFKIVYILLDKKTVKAKYFAELFEVSTRTIYRDVETLSLAGIPIYSKKGKNGGISLLDNFIIDKSLLSEKEKNNLIMGLQTLKAVNYETVDDALIKLKHLFNNDSDNWIEVDFSNWGAIEEDKIKFEKIKNSISNSNKIQFLYYSRDGSKSKRNVYPLKLVFKHKAWYLEGFCLNKKDYRLFKIHRIYQLEVINSNFIRKDLVRKTKKLENNDKNNFLKLKIKFSKNTKYRLFDEFYISNITETKFGYEVEFEAEENEWLYNYLISFGTEIIDIYPRFIRDKIVDRLQNILKSYNKTDSCHI